MVTHISNLVGTLERAKHELVACSQTAATSGQWDLAEFMVQSARHVDGIITGVRQNGSAPPATRPTDQHHPSRPEKLPYYYVEGDKLVKVGRSRDGTTYKHRVTRGHFDQLIETLAAMAQDHRAFESADFVRRCDVPKHEPLIMLGVLKEHELLHSSRRGRWAFVNPATFAADAGQVWDALTGQ
jgi:hypothetical protein